MLEQCQKLDKVWSHIFCATITLNDNTDNWYRKVREIIDKQQSGALWMSESKVRPRRIFLVPVSLGWWCNLVSFYFSIRPT